MNSNKAMEMALRIVNTCKKNEDCCKQCPFNVEGCIVSDGNGIPTDWEVSDIISRGIRSKKGVDK